MKNADKDFQSKLSEFLQFPANNFHPMVSITGEPEIAENVYIGFFSEVNSKNSRVVIEEGCDIASFVSINCADSHKKTLGLSGEIYRKEIHIGRNVFIGSHSVVKGGAIIGHHTVIAAGTIVEGELIPPYSLVSGNPMLVRPGYYQK